MRRRVLCVLAAVWVLLGSCISAEGTEITGSVTVDWGADTGSVTLFQVGTPISGGYVLGQEFGGGIVTGKDVSSRALAQWLCEHVEYEGWTQPANELSVAEFGRLEEGLYLIVQNGAADGYYPFLPFLVELPSEGQWNVLAKPKMESCPVEVPRTGQGMEPFSGMLGMVLSAAAAVMLLKKRKFQ